MFSSFPALKTILLKNHISFEKLREIPHLRPRTNTFEAVFKVRSTLSIAIHNYFQSCGFQYVTPPLITANDAEGFWLNHPEFTSMIRSIRVLSSKGWTKRVNIS